ncbi:MAG: hypothetical protein QGF20_12995, partial [Alphaproteobacteria bacterium]|nr:hypothetical protein [Alphaproteobacteria bacterium]
RGETQQNFSIWVYGETNLARGSGLFVGPDGVATNHHFLTPTDVKSFAFDKGEYQVDVFVKIVGESDVKLLSTIELKIEETEAAKLRETGYGIFFDWGPDSGRYQAHIDQRQNSEMDPVLLLEALHRGVRDLPQSPEEPAKD